MLAMDPLHTLPRLLDRVPAEVLVHSEPEPCPYIEGQTALMPLRLPIRRLQPGELGYALELLRQNRRVQEMLAAFVAAPVQLEMVLSVEDMTYPPGRLGERRLGDDLWLTRSRSSGLATTIRVPVGGPS